MLHYTPEEKDIIIENLKKVQSYVEDKLIPRLRERETATAFIDSKMSFTISSDGDVRFTTGGLSLHFDRELHRDSNVFDSWAVGAKLLLRWNTIKYAITNKLDEMDEDRNTILNFKV